MSGNTTKHGSTGIMHITTQQLLAETYFFLCRRNPAQRQSHAWFESTAGHVQFIVKFMLHITVQCFSCNRLHDLAQENKIVITVNILAVSTEWTFKYAFVHGIYPVVPDIHMFRYANIVTVYR